MLKKVLLVMLGGGIGAMAREALMLGVPRIVSGDEMPIFFANMIASLLIGLTAGLALKGGIVDTALKLFIATGIMGGLSTFSSFVWGADKMLADPSLRLRGIVFVVASMILGFLLAQLGLWIGQRMTDRRLATENRDLQP